MKVELEDKIEFLNSAIKDAQDLIRFIDTKTTFVITLLGAYLATTFLNLPIIIKNVEKFSHLFILTFIGFLFFTLIDIVLVVRIISPANNPNDNLQTISSRKYPKIKYYLGLNSKPSKIFYFFTNSHQSVLEENIENYLNLMANIKEEDIVESLTFELFKVNFIRNIKGDRFKCLLNYLVITTIFFILQYILFYIDNELTETPLTNFILI